MQYLKTTSRLVAEYRRTSTRTPEGIAYDIAGMRRPDGDPEAFRLRRLADGRLRICAPWLMADVLPGS